MEDCPEGPHLGIHETLLQTRKWRTHEQPQAITFMCLRKRVRMEDCREGPQYHHNYKAGAINSLVVYIIKTRLYFLLKNLG